MLVFFLWLVKFLKNLKIIRLLITWRNVAFFLISSKVLGLIDQLQIFWQLYLIKLIEILTVLGLLKLQELIYHRLLTEFGMLVFFKLKSYKISGQIFVLTSSFLRNRQFLVILNGKSSQEYLINAGVPQGSILGPKLFLPYIMTFLMMLSVILVSILISFSTLTVIRHLICG